MNRGLPILAFAAAWIGLVSASAADLTVVLHGVGTPVGDLRVALYDKAETFRKEAQALAVQTQPAQPGEATFLFAGLPPGRYAVLAYHDANGNGKLDLVLGMFPSEGWGLSNSPTVIGPPRFADSAFACNDASPCRVEIRLSD